MSLRVKEIRKQVIWFFYPKYRQDRNRIRKLQYSYARNRGLTRNNALRVRDFRESKFRTAIKSFLYIQKLEGMK